MTRKRKHESPQRQQLDAMLTDAGATEKQIAAALVDPEGVAAEVLQAKPLPPSEWRVTPEDFRAIERGRVAREQPPAEHTARMAYLDQAAIARFGQGYPVAGCYREAVRLWEAREAFLREEAGKR